MVSEKSFTYRLQRWLERWRFMDDPFALYEADRERQYLPYFFVDRPYLHDILGNPARPQAAFLLAGRGAGKTATREMVAYECAHAQLRRRALAVRYYDFSPLLEQVEGAADRVTAVDHVHTIIRYTLKALAKEVPPTYFDLLKEMEQSLLLGYIVTFADPISQARLRQILPGEPMMLDWGALSSSEMLSTLAGLVTQLGQSPESRYQALYVLVDRVDETSAGPEAAIQLLTPLVSAGPILEMSNVAFKFFLPIEVGEALHRAVELRPDRVCIRTVTWNEGILKQMVQQRLSYYSNERIKRLEELCTSGAKSSVMDRLIKACEGSPRTLLRLCEKLIHYHVEHAGPENMLISYSEVTQAIQAFEYQLEVERMPPPPTSETQASAAAEVSLPERGVFLDNDRHVWVDGEPLSPPLSQLEFRLFCALYSQAPEIVPHEELIETVWPSSAWTTGESDEQNLRKLVARLRKRLSDDTRRFVQNARGRGYWLKVR